MTEAAISVIASNAVKIDKGVPIPRGQGRPAKYPWREMEIGDSFLHTGTVGSARSSATHWAKITGFKFITRTTAEGVRVWRVA